MTKTNREIAIETRTKFEFYLMALTFTILGLSIQTAKFGQPVFADGFELLGWLALGTSGVMGLLRAEWIPVAYEIFAKIGSTEEHIRQLQQAQEQGVEHTTTFEEDGQAAQLNTEQSIAKLQGVLTNLERQRTAAEQRIRDRYWWMKWTLLAGIGSLLLARGLSPAISVFDRLTDCYRGPFKDWAFVCG